VKQEKKSNNLAGEEEEEEDDKGDEMRLLLTLRRCAFCWDKLATTPCCSCTHCERNGRQMN
jgi:hypothetical protein